MHGYLLTETRHTQVTRALFSWGPAVGVQQWDVYLEILAESFNFSELVLLLCDLQCKDSMTLGAGSGAPAAPFNAGHLSKHPPLRILTVGSPWFHFTVSVQWVHSVSIDLWLQTSVKWFHLLLHRSNLTTSKAIHMSVSVWLTYVRIVFFFFAVILWNPRKNAGLPSHPLGCCCCLWQTRSEHQLFPHRCDSASSLAGATRARVKKVGIRQKHANLPTWDHKNVLI